jgi:hypothetical protein
MLAPLASGQCGRGSSQCEAFKRCGTSAVFAIIEPIVRHSKKRVVLAPLNNYV